MDFQVQPYPRNYISSYAFNVVHFCKMDTFKLISINLFQEIKHKKYNKVSTIKICKEQLDALYLEFLFLNMLNSIVQLEDLQNDSGNFICLQKIYPNDHYIQ